MNLNKFHNIHNKLNKTSLQAPFHNIETFSTFVELNLSFNYLLQLINNTLTCYSSIFTHISDINNSHSLENLYIVKVNTTLKHLLNHHTYCTTIESTLLSENASNRESFRQLANKFVFNEVTFSTY